MGLYTEAQQQEFLASMRETAQQTLGQLQQVFKLARFGDNQESLQALDRFADEYRAQGVVNDHNTRGYIFGLGTLLGDLLLKKYGGKWVIDGSYSIETRNAAGAVASLRPYAVVTARLNGNTAASIHRYFFIEVPQTLGFPAPAPRPLDIIKNNAAAVVKMFSAPGQGATFGLTAQSVAALDNYIERTVNATTTDATKQKLMNLIGSFLGECIVAKYGAEWTITKEGGPRLTLSAAGTLHFLDPFGKVAKRIQNGSEDNLAFYFAEFIPHVINASR
jgi:hypothetical protein